MQFHERLCNEMQLSTLCILYRVNGLLKLQCSQMFTRGSFTEWFHLLNIQADTFTCWYTGTKRHIFSYLTVCESKYFFSDIAFTIEMLMVFFPSIFFFPYFSKIYIWDIFDILWDDKSVFYSNLIKMCHSLGVWYKISFHHIVFFFYTH